MIKSQTVPIYKSNLQKGLEGKFQPKMLTTHKKTQGINNPRLAKLKENAQPPPPQKQQQNKRNQQTLLTDNLSTSMAPTPQ